MPPAGHDHAAHHPPAGHPGMGGMEDHEHAMHASLDHMQTTLQRMKTGLAGIKDQATRDEMQLNIDLWQSLLDDMSEHMTTMEGMHHDMGMGGKHHGDMHGEGIGMHHEGGMACCEDGMSCGKDKDGKRMSCGDGKDMKCCDGKGMSCGEGKDMKCCADGMACGKGKTETKQADDKK